MGVRRGTRRGTRAATLVTAVVLGATLLVPMNAATAASGAWDFPVPISPEADDASLPRIAHDGNRLIAAWISGEAPNEVVFVSNSDDGLGWTTPIGISTPGDLGSELQLVANSGVTTAGWTRLDGSNQRVQVSTSTNSGGTWRAPTTLSDTGQGAFGLYLATNGSTTVAAWARSDGTRNRVQASSTVNSGADWSGSQTLSPATIAAFDPHVVIAGAAITVSWTTSDGTFVVQSSSSVDGGGLWTVPVSVPGFGLNQQFVDDGVTLTAVYQLFQGTIRSSSSADDGANWSTPVVVSDPFFGQAELTSVVLTPGTGTSTITAAWLVSDGSHQRVATASSSDGGATWSTPLNLSAAGRNATAAQLTTNGETITAVWERFDGTVQRVQSSTSSDGGLIWTLPSTISGDGLDAFTPQVTAFDRTTTVIWRRSDAANDRAEVTSFTIPITVRRLADTDRYGTAVTIAQEFSPGVPVAYLATGTNYPDALSAAAAAASQGGPLLLTPPGSLPDIVKTELQRLNPALVVIVGGTGVVSATVEAQVDAALPSSTIRRDFGADRYETSRIIADRAFAGSTIAFIATGANFPDALSASAAAGALDAPVVLVNGAASSLDAATLLLLTELGVTSVTIAGGTGAVSTGIEQDLIGAFGSFDVQRRSGIDRYATSVAINAATFVNADSVFLATGLGFADALAGAALAGSEPGPLFVVPGTCVPAAVLTRFDQLGADTVTLFGGEGVLSPAVFALTSC